MSRKKVTRQKKAAVDRAVAALQARWASQAADLAAARQGDLPQQVHRLQQYDEERLRADILVHTRICPACGATLEPRVHWLPNGRPIIVPAAACPCPASEAARQQAQAEAEAAGRAAYLARLDWNGFQFYCPALQAARLTLDRWYQDPQGRAILIAGHPGCGKSHLARCVARAFLHEGRFVSEPELLDAIKTAYGHGSSGSEIISPLRRKKMLVLDDVASAHVTAESLNWMREIYWRIFESRREDCLPTLLTSNLGLAELAGRLGPRNYDRLMGMLGDEGGYIDLFGVKSWRLRGWQSGDRA